MISSRNFTPTVLEIVFEIMLKTRHFCFKGKEETQMSESLIIISTVGNALDRAPVDSVVRL